MIVGAVLQTAAIDYAMMLVARVITGVGNGLLTSTVPAYQSECAPPHRRGQLVLIEGSLITFVRIKDQTCLEITTVLIPGYHGFILGRPWIFLHHGRYLLAIPYRTSNCLCGGHDRVPGEFFRSAEVGRS